MPAPHAQSNGSHLRINALIADGLTKESMKRLKFELSCMTEMLVETLLDSS